MTQHNLMKMLLNTLTSTLALRRLSLIRFQTSACSQSETEEAFTLYIIVSSCTYTILKGTLGGRDVFRIV